jgi:hypothetical protein
VENIQVGRTQRTLTGRLRSYLVLSVLCLFALVPLAQAEKQIIKDLNAQIGRTAAEIELQPVWGREGITGKLIGWSVKATTCKPVSTAGTSWDGWTVCAVYFSVPQFTPGMAAYSESRTTSTTTGGDQTITTPIGIGPDGQLYGGNTITLHGPPAQTNSRTVTVDHPGTPSWAYYRDLAIYFFFGEDRTHVVGWKAYVRTRDSIGPSEWSYLDGWQAATDSRGRIKPMRLGRQKRDDYWWFVK